jgi:hypothetical protein
MGNRPVQPYERKQRVCEWNRERLLQIIDFFEAIPGHELQIEIPLLVKATGIPSDALKRHIAWAKKYGILEVHVDAAFGQGRPPNRYVLAIDRATWESEGPGIVAKYQEEAARKPWATRGKKGGNATRLEPVNGRAEVDAWLEVR